jgi:transcriptional regulator with XRE-family HTH domain
MDAAERIRLARTEAGLTQQQLAEHLKVKRAAVAQWEARDETKRTRPTAENCAGIAAVTRVDLAWLITGSGEQHPAVPGKTTPERAFDRLNELRRQQIYRVIAYWERIPQRVRQGLWMIVAHYIEGLDLRRRNLGHTPERRQT